MFANKIKYFMLKKINNSLRGILSGFFDELRYINVKKELIGLFGFLLAYLYYYLSLEACMK